MKKAVVVVEKQGSHQKKELNPSRNEKVGAVKVAETTTTAAVTATAAAASEGSKETSTRIHMPTWMKKAMNEDGRIAFKGSNVGIKIGTLYNNSLSLDEMLEIVKRYQKKLTREQIEFSKSPTPAMLRKNFECIALKKSKDGVTVDSDFAIILYNNGWVEYRSTDRYATLKLTDCSTFTYQYNLVIDDIDKTVLDKTMLGKENWAVCACLAGEEKITNNLIRHSDAVGSETSGDTEDTNNTDGEFESSKRKFKDPVTVARIPNPEERFLAQERRAEIQKIISRSCSTLTNRQAELYKLHFEYDIPLLRVAEMLKIAPSSCTNRVKGIQKRFSEQIEAITGEDVEKYLNLDFNRINAEEGAEEATEAENSKNISVDDLDDSDDSDGIDEEY